MTLLNIASDGYYTTLITCFRCLSTEGKMTKERLVSLCSDDQEETKKSINSSINRWSQLGLYDLDGDNISFSSEAQKYMPSKKDIDVITQRIPFVLRRIIFDENNNNNNFWGTTENRAADITRALSWLLAQDIYSFDASVRKEVEIIEKKQFSVSDLRLLSNDVRFNGLKTWSRYLGFVSTVTKTIVDPYQAILEDIDLVFQGSEELTCDVFIENLAYNLPVLDGGRYRVQIEEKLDTKHWNSADKSELLSTSLSRALWRLENSGKIKLESRSDTKKHKKLQRANNELWKSFTHVILRG